MKIGLVLSTTPAYSETFFLSKINGLSGSGFDVTLFVQKVENDFSLCKVKLSPSVSNRNKLIQFFKVIFVCFGLLLKKPRALFRFLTLELRASRPLPSSLICMCRAVVLRAMIACDFTADSRRRPTQLCSDFTQR